MREWTEIIVNKTNFFSIENPKLEAWHVYINLTSVLSSNILAVFTLKYISEYIVKLCPRKIRHRTMLNVVIMDSLHTVV